MIIELDDVIKTDKETIDAVRNFDTELRLRIIKEKLDSVFGKDIYMSRNWTDEEIAKLDYILCKMDELITKSKKLKVVIEG